MTEQEQRARVVEIARTWLKTPYHHQGRVKGAGVDCAMLLCEVYHEAGLVPQIDPTPYPPDWHLHRGEERYLAWVKEFCRRVDVPQPGDLAMFKFGRCQAHGAIIVDWPQIIHAYIGVGCTLDEGDTPHLAERFRGFWTLKDWSGNGR